MEDLIKFEPSDEAEKQAENTFFLYIFYLNIQVISEKPIITKYYLVGEIVEKQFSWSLYSHFNHREHYFIEKAWISFFCSIKDSTPVFEINLIIGKIYWTELIHS